VVGHCPSLFKALGLIHNTTRKNNNEFMRENEFVLAPHTEELRYIAYHIFLLCCKIYFLLLHQYSVLNKHSSLATHKMYKL
jgi:hypothetical protein